MSCPVLALPLLLCLAHPLPAQQQEHPAGEPLLYRFDAERELADFEVLTGTWSISSGSLWCTTKGPREELRWRRRLTPKGSASIKLLGAGRVGIALRAGEQEALVRIDRAEGRVGVEADSRVLIERPFESKPGDAIALRVEWLLDQLAIRIGDDEPFVVTRPDAKAPFDGLAIVSLKSQPRFDELTVERDAPAGEPLDNTKGATLTEGQRITIERSTQLLEAGDANAAFELIEATIPTPTAKGAAPWPAALLALLQRVGNHRAALLHKEPLAALVAAAQLPARDGSALLVLPLRPGWRAEALEIPRTDGPVFVLHCDDPKLDVEIFRYDQKLKYWFGRDPRLVYSSGGGGATLGRARADEKKDLHAKADFTTAFDKCAVELDDEKAYEYALSWPDPADPRKTQSLHEWFALHRGDTWRITIDGSPLAEQVAADDLAWILARFRFTR